MAGITGSILNTWTTASPMRTATNTSTASSTVTTTITIHYNSDFLLPLGQYGFLVTHICPRLSRLWSKVLPVAKGSNPDLLDSKNGLLVSRWAPICLIPVVLNQGNQRSLESHLEMCVCMGGGGYFIIDQKHWRQRCKTSFNVLEYPSNEELSHYQNVNSTLFEIYSIIIYFLLEMFLMLYLS